MRATESIVFGVVLPTFKRSDRLQKAIESVRAQTYPGWKIVVVNDSGAEAVGAEPLLLKTFQYNGSKQLQSIVYLKNTQNMGVGYSRNRALEALCSEVDFVVFLDDDDFFDADALRCAADFIRQNPSCLWCVSRRVNAVNGASITQLKKQKAQYNYLLDCMIQKNFRKDATHFIAASVLHQHPIRFDEHIRTGGEWRFFCRLAEVVPMFCFFEGGVTYGEYLAQGLSERNAADIRFKLGEKKAFLDYLWTKKSFRRKKWSLLFSLIKHYKRQGMQKELGELRRQSRVHLNAMERAAFRAAEIIF